jgi:hypothetical protein
MEKKFMEKNAGILRILGIFQEFRKKRISGSSRNLKKKRVSKFSKNFNSF